jgi:hypothetical protein
MGMAAVFVVMFMFMFMFVVMFVVMFVFVMMFMFMLVFVFMSVVMFMFVFVMMLMFVSGVMHMLMVMLVFMFVMPRIIVAGDMLIRAFQFYYGVDAGDAVPLIPFKFQLPAAQPQFFQFPPQKRGIDSQINQGPQGHIPGYAGKTVKVQCFHDTSRRLICSLSRSTALSIIRARGICSRPAI